MTCRGWPAGATCWSTWTTEPATAYACDCFRPGAPRRPATPRSGPARPWTGRIGGLRLRRATAAGLLADGYNCALVDLRSAGLSGRNHPAHLPRRQDRRSALRPCRTGPSARSAGQSRGDGPTDGRASRWAERSPSNCWANRWPVCRSWRESLFRRPGSGGRFDPPERCDVRDLQSGTSCGPCGGTHCVPRPTERSGSPQRTQRDPEGAPPAGLRRRADRTAQRLAGRPGVLHGELLCPLPWPTSPCPPWSSIHWTIR